MKGILRIKGKEQDYNLSLDEILAVENMEEFEKKLAPFAAYEDLINPLLDSILFENDDTIVLVIENIQGYKDLLLQSKNFIQECMDLMKAMEEEGL